MSSAVRNGFSTLNRLLGKKNKDSATLSKSTSNLSKSVTNLDSTSQHNKIVPLVAASTNAPFEQTFRITICLPRDQLYVARVGAKTKLWQLLEMVCTNKLLDKNKFEFRHPSNSSQVFDNNLTIGEVGLNEIRLSLKTDSHHETYPKFHTDEIVKLRQNSRESLSSSEFSKNSSRQYAKTTSPYSSTNSLSSMDSTGLNSRHHPPIAPSRKKRIAPRPPSQNSLSERSERSDEIGEHVFKRPHPVMPPKNLFVSSPNLTNNDTKANKLDVADQKVDRIEVQENVRKQPSRPMSLNFLRKNDVQTNGDNRSTYAGPAVTSTTPVTPDISSIPSTPGIPSTPSTPGIPSIPSTPDTPYENHSRTSSNSSEVKEVAPEPIPRKRTFIAKKKAPAPPPRGLPPVAPPRSVSKVDSNEPVVDASVAPNPNITKVMLNVNPIIPSATTEVLEPKITKSSSPVPQSAAIQTPRPQSPVPQSLEMPVKSPEHEVKLPTKDDDAISQTEIDRSTNKTDSSDEDETKVYNIKMGKSLIVETPRKLIENDEVFENIKNENKEVIENTNQMEKVNGIENATMINKNLDHLREATPSPRSESPLWTYTLPAPSKFADDRHSDVSDVLSDTTVARIENTNGDFSSGVSDLSDIPIKPVIQRRIPVDFQALDETSIVGDTESSMTSDIEDGYQGDKVRFSRGALLESLENHRDDFIENEFKFLSKMEGGDEGRKVDSKDDVNKAITNGTEKEADDIPNRKDDVINDLNSVIVNNKLETVFRKSEFPDDIESAQKSCLPNFTIQTYSNHVDVKIDDERSNETISQAVNSPDRSNDRRQSEPNANKSEDEIVLRNPKEFTQLKRPSLSNGNLFKSPRVSRSDSFHSTRNGSTENLGLASRSSSYISLIGTQKYENRSNTATPRNSLTNGTFDDSNRRKSSSELSIADSPSLQSLLVMKSILSNSRKNSLISDFLSNGSKENVKFNEEPEKRKSSIDRSKSPITVDDNDSSKENSPQNKATKSVNQQDPQSNTKWKYQGPPAINLSTWGERPKSMIAIKTDNDYKFGGTNTGLPKYDGNEPSALTTPQESELETSNSIKTTMKSTNVIVDADSVDVPDNHLPIVRAVVKKVHPIDNAKGSSDENHNIEIRRPSYEVSTIVTEKPKTETRGSLQNRFSWKIPATFSSSTSGMNSTANKNVPMVRGFKADALDAATDKDHSIDSGYKSLPPTVVLINSNKDSIQERPKTQPPPTVAKRPSFLRPQKPEETNVVPFSQFTLRKTGLKEKFVGTDTQNNNESVKSPVILSAPIQTIQLRQKQEIQNIRPVTIHTTSARIIPPPPPPIAVKQIPIVRSVTTTRNSLPIEGDPRNALLDSIKQFNKNILKKK